MSEVTKKNIVICGYPKSGSTWATRLTAELLDCPSDGYWSFDGPTLVTEGKERQSSFSCYKSHEQYDDLIRNKKKVSKIIYVIRDPRDMVVSGMFHFRFPAKSIVRLLNSAGLPARLSGLIRHLSAKSKNEGYKIKRMTNMLATGDPYIPHCQWALDDHITSFVNKPDVLFIRYEALLKNGLAEAKKVLQHCGVDKLDQEILDNLTSQSFEKKKESFKPGTDKSKHLRKGVSGDWVNHLSINQKKAIEQACSHEKFKAYYNS